MAGAVQLQLTDADKFLAVQAADAYVNVVYECTDCETRFDTKHSALVCCVECPEDDKCLAAVILVADDAPYGVCYCDGVNGCGILVCEDCHEEYDGPQAEENILTHLRSEHDVTYDPPVDVGGPSSLPPAYEYTQEQIEACAMCASPDFCCGVHGRHKSPHRGCLLRGELKA